MNEFAGQSIVLSDHARGQLHFRGTTEAEAIEAIRTASWEKAELGRLECRRDYSYGQTWNGRYYPTKHVRPIFAVEGGRIAVITVYVYYF